MGPDFSLKFMFKKQIKVQKRKVCFFKAVMEIPLQKTYPFPKDKFAHVPPWMFKDAYLGFFFSSCL